MTSTYRRTRASISSNLLRLVLATLVAMLSVPLAGWLSTASAAPGVCDTNEGIGKVDLFEQNTRENESGDWINGNINAIKGPLYEGQFVPQRLTMINMAAGENEIVIESKLLEGGLHAYDFIPEPGNTTYPGFVPQTTNATITNWDVTIHPVVNGDQWSTIKVTFDVAQAGTVVIKWYPHIASELDYGPGTGAGSINGSPYHNKLVSLNCDSSGSRDNQIMAGAIHYATINVVKDAQPDSAQDFHFSIVPGGNASTFDLDDDNDATLSNTLPAPGFRVAPTTDYTITETNIAAGWTLSAINCVNTGLNTTTNDLANNRVVVHTADNVENKNVSLQGTTVCTFVNVQTSHLTLVKQVDRNGTGDTTPITAWNLKAEGPTTLSGNGGADGDVPAGSYALSETGPSTYSGGAWSCVGGTQNGSNVSLAPGESATCTIINTAILSTWVVEKTAVVVGNPYADPQHAEPGDTIRFTITATRVGSGVDVYNVAVHDNLADVLDDAALTSGPTVTNGSATLNGTTIDWNIAQIHTSVSMTYDVLVNADAYGETIRNVVTAPGSNCPVGSTDPKCTTTHETPHWILTKSADESDGVNDGQVLPGDSITYTLTVHNDSDTAVLDAVVSDDLSDVLDNATPSAELAALLNGGTTLNWVVPTIEAGGADATFSYTVTVNEGAWNVQLNNVATPGPGGNCPTPAQCTTHHETPPVSPFVVKKIDDDTGEVLAGAHFVLWQDNAPIGTLDGSDVSMGEKVTGPNGRASWANLLDGPYLIQETVAPPGYGMPAVTIHAITITSGGRDWAANPEIFGDPAIGNLAIVAKQQFEKNANGVWVVSDGVTDFGSPVKYVVSVKATGTKLFRNVKVTDYIPGFNPADTVSTLKASLVSGTAKCTGGLDCTVTVSPGKLVTWSMGDVRNAQGTVEMVVKFPNAPTPIPFNSSGIYTGTLWNVGYLAWDQAISNVVDGRITTTFGRALAAACAPTSATREHCTLKSNEVVIRASLRKPPPGVVPCQVNCLPNTGSAPFLLQLGILGGLALVAGTLLVARRRRGEATG